MNTATLGKHLLVEYQGCNKELLNDQEFLEQLLQEAAKATGATVVQVAFHRFAPQGVSGVVVVEESHLSIHTWPEDGYAAVDLYTCGDCKPMLAHPIIQQGLEANQTETLEVQRGIVQQKFAIEVGDHQIRHH